MAKLVFGMNQFLDRTMSITWNLRPVPLFRHFIQQVRGLTGSVYGHGMHEVNRAPRPKSCLDIIEDAMIRMKSEAEQRRIRPFAKRFSICTRVPCTGSRSRLGVPSVDWQSMRRGLWEIRTLTPWVDQPCGFTISEAWSFTKARRLP